MEEFIKGDHLVIRTELPGVDPDRDIDVSVDNGILTIAAERQEAIGRSATRATERVPLRQFRPTGPTSGRHLT